MTKYKRTTIKCLICGKKLKAINNAHARMHGYDGNHPLEDYKRDFGLDKVTSEYTRYLIGTAEIGNKKTLGLKLSKSARKKIAEAQLGRNASPETRKKLSKQRKGNKWALGYRHTKKFKKYISQYNKQWWDEKRQQYGTLTQGGNPV